MQKGQQGREGSLLFFKQVYLFAHMHIDRGILAILLQIHALFDVLLLAVCKNETIFDMQLFDLEDRRQKNQV